MSFFPGSSDVTVDNSYFSEIGGDFNINLITEEPAAFVTPLLGKKRERGSGEFDVDVLRKRYRPSSRNSDGLMVVKIDEVKLRTELISRSSYRMHSASYGAQGCVVAVKVFEGPHAKEDWMKDVAFFKKLLHSNIPKIVGVSDESSKVPFVVFHGIFEKRIQPLIAKALCTDLNKSVELSMKAVKGLAAGLSYMNSQNLLGEMIDVHGWENFDIFAGDNEEPIIAIHPPSNLCHGEDASSSSHPFVPSDDHGIEALNGLCQKLFSEVNSVLYDDSPQRESLDAYDETLLPSASIQEVSEGASSISEIAGLMIPTPSNLTKKDKSNRTPRREVRWRLGTGANNRNLDSIARRFGDYIDCFILSSSKTPLRRIRASTEAYSGFQTSHQCPGYLREEITLTSDIRRSAIISHEYPSQSELCLICGQLVQHQVPLKTWIPADSGPWFNSPGDVDARLDVTNDLPSSSKLETPTPIQSNPTNTTASRPRNDILSGYLRLSRYGKPSSSGAVNATTLPSRPNSHAWYGERNRPRSFRLRPVEDT